jgi:hypothetical protein
MVALCLLVTSSIGAILSDAPIVKTVGAIAVVLLAIGAHRGFFSPKS